MASLSNRIDHVLNEARMVLPGVQALLGFQFVGVLHDGFARLPRSSQLMHLLALGSIALATALLMTPPAIHRIAEHGRDSEGFHRQASRLLIAAMVPLALGISIDLFVVARIVLGTAASALVAALSLATFGGLWFGYPLWYREHAPRPRLAPTTIS